MSDKTTPQNINDILVKELVGMSKSIARRNTALTLLVTILAVAVGVLAMAAL